MTSLGINHLKCFLWSILFCIIFPPFFSFFLPLCNHGPLRCSTLKWQREASLLSHSACCFSAVPSFSHKQKAVLKEKRWLQYFQRGRGGTKHKENKLWGLSENLFYWTFQSDFSDHRCLKPSKTLMILLIANWISVFLMGVVVILPQQYLVFAFSAICSANLDFILGDNPKP